MNTNKANTLNSLKNAASYIKDWRNKAIQLPEIAPSAKLRKAICKLETIQVCIEDLVHEVAALPNIE